VRKFVIFLLLAAASLSAQQATARQKSHVCQSEAGYRALDFWVGDWDIYEDGKPAGRQRITRKLDDCSLMAEWFGPFGDNGIGYFAFDRNRNIWVQMWAANQVPYRGGVTIRETDSTYSGPGMRLTSTGTGNSRSRITLMPAGKGNSRALMEVSNDSGKTWKTLFDAEHRPRVASKAKS
jgi:hypothetical protein